MTVAERAAAAADHHRLRRLPRPCVLDLILSAGARAFPRRPRTPLRRADHHRPSPSAVRRRTRHRATTTLIRPPGRRPRADGRHGAVPGTVEEAARRPDRPHTVRVTVRPVRHGTVDPVDGTGLRHAVRVRGAGSRMGRPGVVPGDRPDGRGGARSRQPDARVHPGRRGEHRDHLCPADDPGVRNVDFDVRPVVTGAGQQAVSWRSSSGEAKDQARSGVGPAPADGGAAGPG